MKKRTSKKSKVELQILDTLPNDSTEPVMTDNKIFNFYLDAWNYCRVHDIDMKRIRKVDWKTWEVFV